MLESFHDNKQSQAWSSDTSDTRGRMFDFCVPAQCPALRYLAKLGIPCTFAGYVHIQLVEQYGHECSICHFLVILEPQTYAMYQKRRRSRRPRNERVRAICIRHAPKLSSVRCLSQSDLCRNIAEFSECERGVRHTKHLGMGMYQLLKCTYRARTYFLKITDISLPLGSTL